MNTDNLSNKAKMELKYYIWHGLNNQMDNLIKGYTSTDKETIKEILDWYKDNIIINYNSLKEKFDNIK